MIDLAPHHPGVAKPLGLPVGSVRALLLLSLVARAILDLRAGVLPAEWLCVAVVVSAVAYFSARSTRTAAGPGGAGGGGQRPFGLPAGTVRVLFLAALAYGAWLFWKDHRVDTTRLATVWVLGGFLVGVIVRVGLVRLAIPDDQGTSMIYHLQALMTLIMVGALVAQALVPSLAYPDWVPPLLAAAATYYAGAR